MRALRLKSVAAAAFAGAAMLAVPNVALSAPCSDFNLPNPIYGSGGSAITANLRLVAIELAKRSTPITILYADPGACVAYQQYLNNAITSDFKFWSSTGTQTVCQAPLGGQPADFAHMGNDHEFCVGLTLPSGYPDGYADFLGPVQTVNIVTHKNSSQKSISAEALYYIWGKGAAAAGVEPWTNPAHITSRGVTSFAHQFPALAIFNNSGKIFFDNPAVGGTGPADYANQQAVVNAIGTFGATSPETPIGYISSSAAKDNSAIVKTLAFQAYDQTCGFWPDSTGSTLDKINVRTGKYALWAPGHFFARTSGGSALANVVNPTVRDLIGWYSGEIDQPADFSVTERSIAAGDVPLCAMQVQREGLVGAISSYAPEDPCGCYFEAIATGHQTCDACGSDDDCTPIDPQSKCRRGYCEAY